MKGIVGLLPRKIIAIVLLILYTQCAGPQPGIPEEILEIPVSLETTRFDLLFDASGPEDLPTLKRTYPYLFPEQFPDSIWIATMADTLQQQLRKEVKASFPDFRPYETELELFFKHVAYFFPQTPLPGKVFTITSNVDYKNKVILTDTLLLIGLDNYLGPDHKFYEGLPNFVAKELDPAFMISDVAGDFCEKMVPLATDRSFIAQMVYYGKGLYLKDQLMPLAEDSVKIKYSAAELQWARDNENQVWRYFIERELLYSTDKKLGPRFLQPAPFSKFGLVLDNDSPGRIGQYIGWQIVRSFMEQNEMELRELLAIPEEELFKESNYKPRK
ncbi:MAG: gliding motility lipoprotein GldB [Robiginitalea sp.]|uniref:gliding motility lipoprotein GldB n=1 Tax=Robiginitalea sp. TaxID=1902411 RepID=UPI003C7700A5